MTLYTTLTPAVPMHCIRNLILRAVQCRFSGWCEHLREAENVLWYESFSSSGRMKDEETASSRGVVSKGAAHRGASEWLVCFRWKYVKRILDTLNTNMTHTKQYRGHRPTLTDQLLDEHLTNHHSMITDFGNLGYSIDSPNSPGMS